MPAIDRLYHLAEKANVPSIMKHGLQSTERLLQLTGMEPNERDEFLRRHRNENVRLADGVLVRDQRPMPPSALTKALDDGLAPHDWYALLNSFVFLWPDRERMARHRKACAGRPQTVLTFDGAALFESFGQFAFVSPINSGNARRLPARRGRGTFIPYATWRDKGWPHRARSFPPAELAFCCVIPAAEPYLVSVS